MVVFRQAQCPYDFLYDFLSYLYLKEYDKRGGYGANFIIKWQAEKKVNLPIIEGVMISARQGISFICPGQIITEHSE